MKIGFSGLLVLSLTVVFVTLRLIGVIAWPWWLVLAPLGRLCVLAGGWYSHSDLHRMGNCKWKPAALTQVSMEPERAAVVSGIED